MASCLANRCARAFVECPTAPPVPVFAPDHALKKKSRPPCPCATQPLAEGEKRQWEDWEYSFVPLMTSAFCIYGAAFYFRCVTRPPLALTFLPASHAPLPALAAAHRPKGGAQDVAREEAMRRMAAAEEEEEE